VTDTKASGTGALRFTVTAGDDVDDQVWYYANFRDNVGKKKSTGQTFYVQFRQRFDANFISGTNPFKQGMIGSGDLTAAAPGNSANIESGGVFATSCSMLELVWQRVQNRTYPIMYHSCPGTRSPAMSFDNRPCAGVNNPAGFGCLSSSDFIQQGAQGGVTDCTFQGDKSGCFGYFASEWMTFKVKVTVSTAWYDNDTVYTHTGVHQAWMCREGEACVQIYDFRQVTGGGSCDASSSQMPACQTGVDHTNTQPSNIAYGKMWLLPYSNGIAFPSGGQTWYDELIISEQDIADPSSDGSTPPPTPPAAPTGLTISRVF
jgi:hypothetical protein